MGVGVVGLGGLGLGGRGGWIGWVGEWVGLGVVLVATFFLNVVEQGDGGL